MKVYVPSYFGNSTKRQAAFDEQVQWLAAQGFDPYYFIQGRDSSNISTVLSHSSSPVHPAKARNALLQHFYASDDDWAIFADDDTKLLTDQEQVLDTIRPFLASLPDYVAAAKPAYGGSAPMISDKRTMLEVDKRTFGFTTSIAGGWFFLRNLRKVYNKEIFFDDELWTIDPFVAMEDADFGLNLIDNGWKILSASSLFVAVDLTTESTWSDAKNVVRLQSNQRGKEILTKKWPKYCRIDTYNSVQLVVDSKTGKNPRIRFDGKWIKSNEKVFKNWELPLFSYMHAREAVEYVSSETSDPQTLALIETSKWNDRLNYTVEHPEKITVKW